jgi:hypothetical protein
VKTASGPLAVDLANGAMGRFCESKETPEERSRRAGAPSTGVGASPTASQPNDGRDASSLRLGDRTWRAPMVHTANPQPTAVGAQGHAPRQVAWVGRA